MKHLGTKKLETKRLILRPFKIADAEAMFNNWTSDDEVTEYLSWPTHASVEVTKSILKDWINQYESANFYQWAITLKEFGDEPIGSISIVGQRDSIKMVHVGYCIGKKWWRMGIMSEALAALIKFFFEEVGVNRIESEYDPSNPNSGKVMEKCGMKYEGTLRQVIPTPRYGLSDSCRYAILASDYHS